jgi:hypothetical protein
MTRRFWISAALVLVGVAGGSMLSSLVANTALASSKTSAPPPPPPDAARAFETVEYKFYVPTGTAAFTSEHERELNAMGAQGWRIITPIYAGGILNSYLMMRVRPPGSAPAPSPTPTSAPGR